MTPYQRIIQYLDDDVGRDDLKAAGIYDRRIQRSLLKYHRKEFWARDIVEDIIAYTDTSLSIQEIDLRNLARFRKLAYLRDFDPNAVNNNTNPPTMGLAGQHFTEISLPFSVDYFGYDKTFVYYRAGEILRLRSDTRMKNSLIGYFIDPLLEPVANVNSWLADLYPDLIAADVKVKIFGDIGKDDEKKDSKDERAESELTLFANNLYVSYQKG